MSHSHSHSHAPTANRRGRATSTVVEDQFLQEVRRRWERIRGLVRATVGYQNDAFDLRANAEEREAFDFPTDRGQAKSFLRWLRSVLQDELLEPVPARDVREGRHWTAAYIRAAVTRGVNQSTGLLFQQGASVENIPDDEIVTRPIFQQTLEQAYTRAYQNLRDITETEADDIRETITKGLAEGWNPRKMADRLTADLRSIQHSRAETLARTETIEAHSDATLRNYERAGVNTVSHGEWQATPGLSCPFCRRLSGVELTLEEMASGAVEWRGSTYRLKPPAHPNGTCVILPGVGGSPPSSPLSERVPGTVLSGA